jgi:hypothetical protein
MKHIEDFNSWLNESESELLDPVDIIENGTSFNHSGLIKVDLAFAEKAVKAIDALSVFCIDDHSNYLVGDMFRTLSKAHLKYHVVGFGKYDALSWYYTGETAPGDPLKVIKDYHRANGVDKNKIPLSKALNIVSDFYSLDPKKMGTLMYIYELCLLSKKHKTLEELRKILDDGNGICRRTAEKWYQIDTWEEVVEVVKTKKYPDLFARNHEASTFLNSLNII